MSQDRKSSIPVHHKSATAQAAGRHQDPQPPGIRPGGPGLDNEAWPAIEGHGDQAMAGARGGVRRGVPGSQPLRERQRVGLPPRGGPTSRSSRRGSRKILARVTKDQTSFPFALNVTGLDGKTISLDDYKGKVTIIDFWGTWCPPCRQEIPVLAGFARKYQSQGLAIIGINCNEGPPAKARPKVLKFLQENKVPYPCSMSDGEVEAQVPDLKGFPTTLFLDRTGKVRLKMVGFDPGEAGVMEQVVKALLEEK